MSSGLDAFDFGLNRRSVASEDSYQSSGNWTQTILNAPMINEPFKVALYGGANPHLLGVAFTNSVSKPYLYMHKMVFEPLGFKHYIVQTDDDGRLYFGGGMHFS